MIRLIAYQADAGQAANVGGPVNVSHKTFDIECPDLEKWLNQPMIEKWSYVERGFVGMEVLPNA